MDAMPFVAGALGFAAIVLAACGLFLVFVDIDPGMGEPSPVRRRLSQAWLSLAEAQTLKAPMAAISATVRAADQFVFHWFEQSERNVITSGAFALVVLVAIPLAALVNWLRGGSPFLLVFIVACAFGVGALTILSESGRLPKLGQLLAVVLSVAIFLFVPGYVFVSLTDHTLNMPIGHAALSSVLVVPLLYFVCHSAVLLGTGTWGRAVPSIRAGTTRRLATLCAAALPIAYLAVFVCLVLGHMAAPEAKVPATWSALVTGMAAAAVSAAVTIHLVRPTGSGDRSRLLGLCIASGVAAALALGIALTASGWLIALPLIPPLLLWVGAALGLLAKGLILALGDDVAGRRPYLVAGLGGLIIAAGAGWASAVL